MLMYVIVFDLDDMYNEVTIILMCANEMEIIYDYT